MHAARLVSLAWMLFVVATGCVADDGTVLARTGATELVSEAGRTTVEITSDPSPVIRGANDFLVRIKSNDPSASTVAIVSAEAFMPAHGHGTSKQPSIALEGEQYRIAGVNLSMPGRWEITLGLDADGRSDSLRFGVEVP